MTEGFYAQFEKLEKEKNKEEFKKNKKKLMLEIESSKIFNLELLARIYKLSSEKASEPGKKAKKLIISADYFLDYARFNKNLSGKNDLWTNPLADAFGLYRMAFKLLVEEEKYYLGSEILFKLAKTEKEFGYENYAAMDFTNIAILGIEKKLKPRIIFEATQQAILFFAKESHECGLKLLENVTKYMKDNDNDFEKSGLLLEKHKEILISYIIFLVKKSKSIKDAKTLFEKNHPLTNPNDKSSLIQELLILESKDFNSFSTKYSNVRMAGNPYLSELIKNFLIIPK